MNYENAISILRNSFAEVEELFINDHSMSVSDEIKLAFDSVFSSSTQAYREVLLGCILARCIDQSVNIRLPYISQGTSAFNGRTLDERVVNPFLKDKRIPASKGPYLAVFRRQVEFNEDTREGLRDKLGYDAFLSILGALGNEIETVGVENLLRYTLYKFLLLREDANIPLTQIRRLSLPQYEMLVDDLLGIASGGLMPMLVSVAVFQSIIDTYELNWQVEYRGVNVSDRAAGAGGDITIERQGSIILAVEVTERAVDKARVVTTFQTKIATAGIEDYLFLVNLNLIDEDARSQAHQYFAQGHEVNFVDIGAWVKACLATLGIRGRSSFQSCIIELLDDQDVPRQLKVAWNSAVGNIASG